MTQVTKLKITLDRIHCHLASADVTSEPGTEDEWQMVFTVDGQPHSWHEEHVKTGQDYHLGFVFTVPLDPEHPHKTIHLSVSGVEEDGSSANDSLPPAQDTLDPGVDWRIGDTYSFSGANSEYAYEVFYKVEAAETGQAVTAAREFAGVCRSGSGAYALWAQPWKAFRDTWEEMSGKGLRLTRLASYFQEDEEWTIVPSGERIFLGVFGAGDDGYALWVAEWPSFVAKWKELSANGLRLVDISTYRENGRPMFAGTYRSGTDGYALWVAEWDSFLAKWKELSAKGLRLVALDTYTDRGRRHYAGVYREGTDGYAMWFATGWTKFAAKCAAYAKQGLRLVDVCSYPSGDGQVFGGVFRAGSDDQVIVPPSSWTDFTATWKAQSEAERRLVAIETFVAGAEE